MRGTFFTLLCGCGVAGLLAPAGAWAQDDPVCSPIVAWGENTHGQCDVPAPNEGFMAVAAGYYHSLDLKADRAIVAWGDNEVSQCDVPAPNTGFVAVAGGHKRSLGIRVRIPGNVDGDGDVDLADLAELLGIYGTTGGATYGDGDLDGDGDVDLADLTELLAHYGEGT